MPAQTWLSRKGTGTCEICNGAVPCGTPIRPLVRVETESDDAVNGIKRKPVIVWVHADCVSAALALKPQTYKLPPCKHIKNCSFGESCAFSHEVEVECQPVLLPETATSDSTAVRGKRSWGRNRRAKVPDSDQNGLNINPVVRKEKPQNDFRAAMLRQWAMRKFPWVFNDCRTLSKSIVLDIAGGKGELGFELAYLSNVRAVVVEPKALELKRFERAWARGMYHKPRKTGGHFPTASTLTSKTNSNSSMGQLYHLRTFFDRELLDILSCGSDGRLSKKLKEARETKWTSGGEGHEEDFVAENQIPVQVQSQGETESPSKSVTLTVNVATPEKPQEGPVGVDHDSPATASTATPGEVEESPEADPRELPDENGPPEVEPNISMAAINSSSVTSESFCRTSPLLPPLKHITSVCEVPWMNGGGADPPALLLGMHPDQATGDILYHAIDNGIPFAVVPCCVHGYKFPERRLEVSGSHVVSYEQFIQWLVERSEEIPEKYRGNPIKVETIEGFGGRNKVVYWEGPK